REENAKAHYSSAPLDSRDAWLLFTSSAQTKQRFTEHLVRAMSEQGALPEASDTLAGEVIEESFGQLQLESRFQGVYLERLAVRDVSSARELLREWPDERTTAQEREAL